MTSISSLRALLKGPPYTNVPSWSESLRLIGPEYVDGLTDDQIKQVKQRLDQLIADPTLVKKTSFYDDDPVEIGLDRFAENIDRED
jgi:hypothetical protein